MSNKNLILSVIAILWTAGAWIAVLYIDRSCEFVRIIGRAHQEQVTIDDVNNNTADLESTEQSLFNDFDKNKEDGQIVSILHRGIHKGHLSPFDNPTQNDICTAWSYYNNNKDDDNSITILDTEMIVTRTSSIISVVLGLFVLISLVIKFIAILCCDNNYGRNNNNRCLSVSFQVCVILSSICVAICQLLTHQMSKSELCDGTNIVTSQRDNIYDFVNLVVWEECDTNTTSYKLTYVTTIGWIMVAILTYFITRNARSTASAQDVTRTKNQEQQKHEEVEDTTTSSHDHIHNKLHGSHSSSDDVDNFFGVGKV